MNTDTELHARWLRSQADALVLDYTAQDELKPHKSLYDTLAILLMWRTADDQATCKQAIEEAAERLAVQRDGMTPGSIQQINREISDLERLVEEQTK